MNFFFPNLSKVRLGAVRYRYSKGFTIMVLIFLFGMSSINFILFKAVEEGNLPSVVIPLHPELKTMSKEIMYLENFSIKVKLVLNTNHCCRKPSELSQYCGSGSRSARILINIWSALDCFCRDQDFLICQPNPNWEMTNFQLFTQTRSGHFITGGI